MANNLIWKYCEGSVRLKATLKFSLTLPPSPGIFDLVRVQSQVDFRFGQIVH